jgi:hypothetical protein
VRLVCGAIGELIDSFGRRHKYTPTPWPEPKTPEARAPIDPHPIYTRYLELRAK